MTIAVGTLLIVLAFFYTGTYSKAFGRGKPDIPPTRRLRIVLGVLGFVFVLFGLVRSASKP